MKFRYATKHSTFVVFLLLCLGGLGIGGLSACGNKGPLYIPAPPVEQQPAPAERQVPAQDESSTSSPPVSESPAT
jgi:predicted small lipoprotein YifL